MFLQVLIKGLARHNLYQVTQHIQPHGIGKVLTRVMVQWHFCQPLHIICNGDWLGSKSDGNASLFIQRPKPWIAIDISVTKARGMG